MRMENFLYNFVCIQLVIFGIVFFYCKVYKVIQFIGLFVVDDRDCGRRLEFKVL